jgi:hypothetical protein
MAKKIRIKIPSVLNSTLESVPDSNPESVPDSSAPAGWSGESYSTKKANKSREDGASLLKPLKSLNGNTTTKAAALVKETAARVEVPSSSSQTNLPRLDYATQRTQPLPAVNPDLPEPPPEDAFHIGLCSAFLRASKGPPTRRQSVKAYRLLGSDWKAFLAWLPAAKQFKATDHAGGLLNLVEFFRAQPPAPAPVVRSGDTSPERWPNQGSFAADREHWDELEPHWKETWRSIFPEECPR